MEHLSSARRPVFGARNSKRASIRPALLRHRREEHEFTAWARGPGIKNGPRGSKSSIVLCTCLSNNHQGVCEGSNLDDMTACMLLGLTIWVLHPGRLSLCSQRSLAACWSVWDWSLLSSAEWVLAWLSFMFRQSGWWKGREGRPVL